MRCKIKLFEREFVRVTVSCMSDNKRRKRLNEQMKKKIKLEQGWNTVLATLNSRGGGYGTIPRYGYYGRHCHTYEPKHLKNRRTCAWLRIAHFQRFDRSKLTKHHKEAALMSQAHAAALQASAASAAAKGIVSHWVEQRDDESMSGTKLLD